LGSRKCEHLGGRNANTRGAEEQPREAEEQPRGAEEQPRGAEEQPWEAYSGNRANIGATEEQA